jgi:hypothetical protein
MMTVSPEERFHQRQPRYSKEEFARRGNEIYESQLSSLQLPTRRKTLAPFHIHYLLDLLDLEYWFG